MPTILIWRLGALGDTLLLLPALAALRAAFPAHRVVAAGHPTPLAAARWSGLADSVLDASAPGLAPLLAGEAPIAGALPTDIEIAVVWSSRGATIARGLMRAGARRVLTAPAIPEGNTPVAEHYLATLAPLGVTEIPFTLRAPAAAHAAVDQAWLAATRENADHPVVLLHPGAGAAAKRWPLERYRQLADRLAADDLAVAWTTGPADADIRARLAADGEGMRLLPPLGLAELAAVVERAAVVVSADSGIAHLAALLGVRGVALFGPTDHRVWGPPSARTIVAHLALPCAPCGDIARVCPSHICLRGLSAAAVQAAIRVHLEQQGQDREIRNVGRGAHPVPSRPADYHSPVLAPGPPGALRVGVWGSPSRWRLQPSIARR